MRPSSPTSHAPNTPGTKPGKSADSMGTHPLICVFGVHTQNYGAINTEGICEYAFIPFYAQATGDTFDDDSNPIVQELLAKATASTKTSFGIHVPYAKVTEVTTRVSSGVATKKLTEYWTTKKVLHYAIVDICSPSNLTSQIVIHEATMRSALDLLKLFREEQTKLQAAHPSSGRGFIIAGVRIWQGIPSPTTVGYIAAMNKSTLKLDAFILITHMLEYEFDVNFPFQFDCLVTGGAPYVITGSKNPSILGMDELLKLFNTKFTQILDTTPLAVSVSLCTRLYKVNVTTAPMYKHCFDPQRRPNSTATFCNEQFYDQPIVHDIQLTEFSVKANTNSVVTYDTNHTISTKYCKSVKTYFASLKFGLALFDIECEDWENQCSSLRNGLAGSSRIGAVAAYQTAISGITDVNALQCTV